MRPIVVQVFCKKFVPCLIIPTFTPLTFSWGNVMQTGVTIYKCNLADQTVKILKDDGLLESDINGNATLYTAVLNSCLNYVHPDDRSMVREKLLPEYVSRTLKDASSYEFQFRTVRSTKSSTFRCFVSRANEDDSFFLGLEDISWRLASQEENERKSRETEKLVEHLSKSYRILHLVNMNDDTYSTVKMDDGVIGKGLELPCFSKARHFFVLRRQASAERMTGCSLTGMRPSP